jgi:preprotein translocase subunit SecY
VAESAAEAFFRSEIRRRLTITAVLILLSRVGYFIPLPGFDRRLIPDSYLSFAPLPAGLSRRSIGLLVGELCKDFGWSMYYFSMIPSFGR